MHHNDFYPLLDVSLESPAHCDKAFVVLHKGITCPCAMLSEISSRVFSKNNLPPTIQTALSAGLSRFCFEMARATVQMSSLWSLAAREALVGPSIGEHRRRPAAREALVGPSIGETGGSQRRGKR